MEIARYEMVQDGNRSGVAEDAALIAAARSGDEAAFGAVAERHRRELHVHCYRMLGSYDDAEDMVQETFLRAWRRRDTYEGRSTFRAWLYRIATNACLDFLDGRSRRAQPYQAPPLVDPDVPTRPPVNVSWLQPYPDQLLEPAAPGGDEPDAVVVAKETIELAFLITIQQLPPRQRAVLVMRDVLGWPAAEAAATLETSVASVKSALQRARATVKEHLPRSRDEWAPPSVPTSDERLLLQRYVDAHQRADLETLRGILADDVLQTMPPHPVWIAGREALLSFSRDVFDPASAMYHGEWRCVLAAANRQPAVAHYVQRPSAVETRDLSGEYRAQVIDVLRIENGVVAEITAFEPHRFALFGLPLTLP